LFDLAIGRADVRPDAAMGYQACLNASAGYSLEGNLGAGTGATVGKLLGMGQAMKAGLGIASLQLAGDLRITAVVAVNALGDIVDPQTGGIIAGARRADGSMADTLEMVMALGGRPLADMPRGGNTTLGAVLTNARLNREQANKVAQMAQDGLARAVRPAHTMLDGDTIFAMAFGEVPADVNVVGALAAEVFAAAVVRAARMAHPAGGLPSASNNSA
jgi:L-aminopeptidase/D-esterase-like protein